MSHKAYTLPVELKSIGDDGHFTGYAATFGNIDAGGDVIVKGAFEKYLMESGTNLPTVCWQHDICNPIGITTIMLEDDAGLYVEGKLLLEVQQAREARALAQAGAIKGLSIGYFVKEREYRNDGVRVLKELTLLEYSFVTRPMNSHSTLTSVKTELLDSVRECELYLRDALGMSRSEAKTLISRIRNADDVRDEQGESKADDDLAAQLKALNHILRGAPHE